MRPEMQGAGWPFGEDGGRPGRARRRKEAPETGDATSGPAGPAGTGAGAGALEWVRVENGRRLPPGVCAPPALADRVEAYPGAGALADVASGVAPEVAASRLAAVRLALAAASGAVRPPLLERERAAAGAYLRAAGTGPELGGLEAAITAARPGPKPALAHALTEAALASLLSGAWGGAASLGRTAYAVAAPRGWEEEAARAASVMALLARVAGVGRAATTWRRRAARHRRRLES